MLKTDRYIKIFVFIIIFILLLSKHFDFLVGNKLHYHDSLAAAGLSYITFDSLINNHFPPLWSNLMNNGQPLFVNTELLQYFDPVSVIVSIIYYKLGLSNVLAYSLINIIWLFIFSLGGMLCSRFISKNWWINFTVFSILFGGPVGYSLITQHCFIHPFRYIPLVVYAFLKFMEQNSYKRALFLGTCIAIAEASFQTIFSLFFLIPFFVIYILLKYFKNKDAIKVKIKYLFLIIIIAVIGMLPALASGIEMLKLFPVAREYLKYGWCFSVNQFFIEPFLPNLFNNWHGSAYIGLIPVFLVYFTLAIFLLKILSKKSNLIKRIKFSDFSSLELTWILMLIINTILCLGLLGLNAYIESHGAFLGVRNFGLMITLIIFIFSQLAAMGLKKLTENFSSLKKFLKFLYISLGIIIFILYILFFCFNLSKIYLFLIFLLLNLSILAILAIYLCSNIVHKLFERITAINCFTFLMFLVISVCLFIFPNRIINTPLTSSNLCLNKDFMVIKNHSDIFNNQRKWMVDAYEYEPFQVFAPIIFHENYARLKPVYQELKYSKYVTNPGTPLYFFDIPRYHYLTTSNIDEKLLKSVLGVTAPIIKAVPYAIKSSSLEESLNLLKNIKNPKLLDKLTIVEGNFPKSVETDLTKYSNNIETVKLQNFKIKKFTQDNIIIEFNIKKDCILVYSDNYTKDWQVYVNSEPKNLLIANVTNKAVFLKKGHNIVQFIYKPMFYIISFWLRFILCLLFIVWVSFAFIYKKAVIKGEV